MGMLQKLDCNRGEAVHVAERPEEGYTAIASCAGLCMRSSVPVASSTVRPRECQCSPFVLYVSSTPLQSTSLKVWHSCGMVYHILAEHLGILRNSLPPVPLPVLARGQAHSLWKRVVRWLWSAKPTP